jgi:hypothetical protein
VTASEAKRILQLRRGPADEADPEVQAALAFAQNDPELLAWLQAQERFHGQLQKSFRALPVPVDLAARLRQSPRRRLLSARHFPIWAAAAALIAAFAFVFFNRTFEDHDFTTFRSRMVRSVLRQYQMDIETNSMPAIRQFLGNRQAPADYVLTEALHRLPPRGAGVQSWLGERVAMVCFDARTQGTAILFVVDARHVNDPPPTTPAFLQVSKLMTVSWTAQGRAYLLMVDNPATDLERLRRLLQAEG